MVRRLLASAVVFAALFLSVATAEAKVPIPCTGDKIVKVANLPKTEGFELPDGRHVDLAWLYQGCFSGKWIGYIGSSSRFVTWKDGMLPELVAASGMKALPEEPGLFWGLRTAPGQFWVEWLYIVVITLTVAIKLATAKGTAAGEPNQSAPEADFGATANAVSNAETRAGTAPVAAIRTASRSVEAAPRRPARIASAGSSVPRQATPTFGRRA